jgi:hypothetical protein
MTVPERLVRGMLLVLVVLMLPGEALAQLPARFKLPWDLREVSGLYIQHADSLWWHNDSGDAATIYQTDGHGRLRQQITLPTRAVDWEDITADDVGHLYLGDVGDNRRQRTELKIFRYHLASDQLDSIVFQYPEALCYDVEAIAWYRDSIHLFTKSRIRRANLPTYHFVVPAAPGTYTAELRDSLFLRKRAVTAAAIDPDTGELALLAYYYTRRLGFLPYSAANVYTFRNGPAGYPLRGNCRKRRISFLIATQYESLDFWGREALLVASEMTLFIKAKAKRVPKP